MSPTAEFKRTPEEHKLVTALLRRKVISDGQLKAAMDYQRSLGGQLSEIIVKLGLARAAQIEEALINPAADSSRDTCSAGNALDPSGVKPSDLKVHRKLLEKIPPDLQEKYLLVPFFPQQNGDSRRIVMGHGHPVPPEVISKIKSHLGVDLYTLVLEESVARQLVSAESRSEPARREPLSSVTRTGSVSAEKPRAETPRVEPPQVELMGEKTVKLDPVSTDHLIYVLMSLLMRKGILSREELEAELLVTASMRAAKE